MCPYRPAHNNGDNGHDTFAPQGRIPGIPFSPTQFAGTSRCLLLAACGGGGSDSASGNDDDAGGSAPLVVIPPVHANKYVTGDQWAMVGGNPMPLVLLRAADASSSGMRFYSKQATMLPGTGDGRYAMNGTDGVAVVDATVLGTSLARVALADVLDFDTPVVGVAQTRAAPPGHPLFNNGAIGQLEGGRLLLGVRH